MVQPRQPTQKQPPLKPQEFAGGNVLFAVAVIAVIVGGVLLFMRSGSSQPAAAVDALAAAAASDATALAKDATTPASTAAAETPAQDATAVPTAPPKKRPPANAAVPPLAFGDYTPARPWDQVNAAHEWAATHPDVAQYIPCFCGCEQMAHKGNDDCFVRARDAEGRVTAWEPHGVACEVCLDVANQSRQMYASGASVTQIRSAIVQRYRPNGGPMTPTPMPLAKSN